MVFDWFQRRLAKPEAAASPAESDAPETPPAETLGQPTEGGDADGDQQAAPSTPTAPLSPEPPPAPAAPSPAGIDSDALAWAREAYARLKAEQQAARQAESPAPAPAPEPEPEALPPQPEPHPEAQTETQGLRPAPDLQSPEPEAQSQSPEPEAQSQSPEPEPEPGGPGSPAEDQPAESLPMAPGLSLLAPETPQAETQGLRPALDPQSSEPEAQSQSPEPEPEPEPGGPESPAGDQAVESLPMAPGLSLLERAAAEREQRRSDLVAQTAPPVSKEPAGAAAVPPAPGPALVSGAAEAEPRLGEFDEAFTWSAEVLAAQGRSADQVTLEEIDWLARLRRGLEKTRRGFVSQLLEKLGDDPLTPEVLDDLESTLLRADVGVQATDQVIEALRARLNQEVVEASEGLRFLKEQLRELLEQPIQASGRELLAPERDRLNVWLLVGVNGVGKTTTLGKLANLAVRSGYTCLIAAADTFRAAAVEQVRIWGERSGVAVIANPSANADPAAVVFDAIGAAKANGTELVLVDTAGRLQTKHNLMEELSKVRRIIDKLAPESAVESLLVLDASQGQNGLRQALAFAKAAGLTGVVITKLDGSSRGGVALAVCREVGLPIRFIGAGEGLRDLRPFNSYEFVEALLAT